MPLIQATSLSKTYLLGETEVHALKNINLHIKEKEYLAIIGSSGSGKSTLMHLLGLLDTPTTGTVKFNNKDVSKLTEVERAILRNRHIGFVFQQFNLLGRTTAVDNVSLPLIYSGISRAEREKKAIKVLESVGLGKRLDHHPTQLSGGQQQRVAIARALVNNPEIIFADEPTGNLDSKSGAEIMTLLSDLNKQGNTIVLVTHELDIAKNTKRIIEIKDGEIVKDELNGKH